MMKSGQFPLCIECMTYNQAQYIEDTLDGFCMQQTTFPFVCVIMDDASTDGEQAVITKYMEKYFSIEDNVIARKEETENYIMTFAQHKKNKHCYFAVFFLKYNHYSVKKWKEPYYAEWRNHAKYIAMCEGDDFWTHTKKLQMQYDYLESHPDFVLSCHRFTVLDVTTGLTKLGENYYFDNKKHSREVEFEFDLNYSLRVWVTKTLTNMYRRSAIKDDYYVGYKYPRDVHFNYYVMTKGKGVCHSFNGGTYRQNVSTSVFGKLSKNMQDEINCKVYEELAEVTHDPAVKETANSLIILGCMNRLKSVGGGYFYALKLVSQLHRLSKFIRRGFKRGISPVSS